jgi:type I restriction enzyme S subunit
MTIHQFITDNLDIWTAAETEKKSGRGRSSGNAASVYGIKKLRELILELAVRGKLVPQDANDEPASKLLKRIQVEKAKLITEGKIKNGKPLLPITAEDIQFELPQGWERVRLEDVAYSQAGFAFKSNGFNESGLGLPLIRIRDVGQPFTGTYFDGEFRDEFVVVKGDHLISMDGEFRVAKWLNEKSLLNQRVSKLVFLGSEIVKAFVAESLQAQLRMLQGVKAYTTVDHLSGGQISNSIIALPPVVEQQRIVAKVDELMALCDQLETQHSNSAEAHEKLVSHLLGTLTQSQSAEDFSYNWQRIAAHFDTVFTTEVSIDALKQTLLQLAVMGKLVPQDANDEPASELLKRIQAEKAKLIAEGKIKKDKPLAPITDDEQPFSLPQGWEWVRLADLLALLTDGDHQAPPKAKSGVPFLVIGNLNTGNVLLEGCRYVPEEYYEKLDWVKKPNKNDILYTVTGSYGIPIKVDISDKFCVQRHVAILKTVESTPINYLGFLLKSRYALQYATEIATGIAQKTVPLTGLRIMPIASPPEAEQRRIVAKVDELMVFCDQLKSRITEANQLQQKLADVLVEKAIY